MKEPEPRKKEVSQGNFTNKKVKNLPDDAIASSLMRKPDAIA